MSAETLALPPANQQENAQVALVPHTEHSIVDPATGREYATDPVTGQTTEVIGANGSVAQEAGRIDDEHRALTGAGDSGGRTALGAGRGEPLAIAGGEAGGEQSPPQNVWTADRLKEALRVQSVDMTRGVNNNAADQGGRYIKERIRSDEGGFWARTGRRIWYGNAISREFIQNRAARRARDQMVDEQNVLAAQGGSQEEHQRAASAVIGRMADGYLQGEGIEVDESRRESNTEFEDIAGGAAIKSQTKDLLLQFARGDFGDGQDAIDTLTVRAEEIREALSANLSANDKRAGLVVASNLVKVGVNARAAFKHGVGLADIEENMTFMHGVANIGANTEAAFTRSERLADKLSKSRIIPINEATANIVASTAVVAMDLGTNVALRTLGRAGTGISAYIREKRLMRMDRTMQQRENATSEDYVNETPGAVKLGLESRRDQELAKTDYNRVKADDVILGLTEARLNAGEDVNSLRAAVNEVVNARTRMDINVREGIDLIAWGGNTYQADEKRWMILKSIAQARESVQAAINNADEATLRSAGIVTEGNVVTRDLNTLLNERSAALEATLYGEEGGITEQDKAFTKLQRWEAGKKAVVAMVSSEIFADTLQEAHAAVSSDRAAVWESGTDGETHQTRLSALKNWIAGGFGGGVEDHTQTFLAEVAKPQEPVAFGDNLKVALPEGYSVAHDTATDTWSVKGQLGQPALIEGVKIDDSTSAEQLIQQLKGAGIEVGEPSTETVTYEGLAPTGESAPPNEYVQQHPDQFDHVKRGSSFNNGTVEIDRNERGMQWGGEGGNGINENGDYVFNLNGFTENGSMSQGEKLNYLEAVRRGELSVALSVSKDTQAFTINVPLVEKMDADGNPVLDPQGDPVIEAVIDKNSLGGQLFSVEDGEAVFHGAYAEVTQNSGELTDDGRQIVRSLATHVGDNNVTSLTPPTHEVTTVEVRPTPSPDVNPLVNAPPAEALSVDRPLLVPVYGRRENNNRNAQPEQPNQQQEWQVPVAEEPPIAPRPDVIDGEIVPDAPVPPRPSLENIVDGEIVPQMVPMPRPISGGNDRPELTSAPTNGRPELAGPGQTGPSPSDGPRAIAGPPSEGGPGVNGGDPVGAAQQNPPAAPGQRAINGRPGNPAELSLNENGNYAGGVPPTRQQLTAATPDDDGIVDAELVGDDGNVIPNVAPAATRPPDRIGPVDGQARPAGSVVRSYNPSQQAAGQQSTSDDTDNNIEDAVLVDDDGIRLDRQLPEADSTRQERLRQLSRTPTENRLAGSNGLPVLDADYTVNDDGASVATNGVLSTTGQSRPAINRPGMPRLGGQSRPLLGRNGVVFDRYRPNRLAIGGGETLPVVVDGEVRPAEGAPESMGRVHEPVVETPRLLSAAVSGPDGSNVKFYLNSTIPEWVTNEGNAEYANLDQEAMRQAYLNNDMLMLNELVRASLAGNGIHIQAENNIAANGSAEALEDNKDYYKMNEDNAQYFEGLINDYVEFIHGHPEYRSNADGVVRQMMHRLGVEPGRRDDQYSVDQNGRVRLRNNALAKIQGRMNLARFQAQVAKPTDF